MLVPLIFGAAEALLQYAGWAAVYSGNYGLQSQASLIQEAATKARLYGGLLATLTIFATLLTAALVAPMQDEEVSGSSRWVTRIALSIVIVVVAILTVAIGLSTVGRYLK
ncbi:MAG: hypothetical protein WBQ95_20275 [Terracidiphilus sp.]